MRVLFPHYLLKKIKQKKDLELIVFAVQFCGNSSPFLIY